MLKAGATHLINIKKIAYLYLTTFLLLFSTQSFAVCQRWIDNHSNASWEFSFTEHTDLFISGNGHNYMCKPGFHCTISVPPHQQATLFYYPSQYVNGFTYAVAEIKDKNGTMKSYTARGEHHNCPHIEHSGRTGGVSMNEPNDGAFTIDQDTW
jgi:hypothetical protein